MRVVTTLVVATVSISTPAAAAEGRLQDAVVFIRVVATNPVNLAREEVSQGSGFLVDRKGHIIMARHVAEDRPQISGERSYMVALRHRDAKPVPADLVKCETGNIDLCMIKVPDAAVATAGIRRVFTPVCRHLRPGEAITGLGYPQGLPLTTAPGIVSSEGGPELKISSNVPIVPGMSGGPVVDADTLAVAVNAGGTKGYPVLTFIQPLIRGQQLLALAGISCGIPKSSFRDQSPVGLSTALSEGMTIRFDPIRAEQVLPQAEQLLNKVVNWLKSNPAAKLVIGGHASATMLGKPVPDDAADKLSARRAETIQAALISRGVAPGRLRAVSYGSTMPEQRGLVDAPEDHQNRVVIAVDAP